MIAPRRHRRPGTILVLFALLVFALLAMAALVIDLGLVRVTQQQMQSMVEGEAVEGLRYQDANNAQAGPQAARDVTTFRLGANPNVIYQAGPDITITPGVGDANALQIMQPGTAYLPIPQLNPTNAPHGDLVAGKFTLTNPPTEDSSYQRNDFTPSTSGQTAFLARMRRTRNLQGVDRNSLDNTDVSTSGNAVPLLFGRAALFASVPADSQTYSPRRDGITVRATAIAAKVAAKTVGPAYPENSLYGVAPFALSLNFWQQLPSTATVSATGAIAPTSGSGAGQMVRVTSLVGALSDAATTLTVSTPTQGAPGTGFPGPPFVIRIDSELLTVTAVNGANWSVQRGVEGTSPAAHNTSGMSNADGVPVLLHTVLPPTNDTTNPQRTLLNQMTLGRKVDTLPSAMNNTTVDLSSYRPGHLDQLANQQWFAFVPLYDDASGLVAGFGQLSWRVTSSTWPDGSGVYSLTGLAKVSSGIPLNASAAFTVPQSFFDLQQSQNMTAAQLALQLQQLLGKNSSLTDGIMVPALVR